MKQHFSAAGTSEGGIKDANAASQCSLYQACMVLSAVCTRHSDIKYEDTTRRDSRRIAARQPQGFEAESYRPTSLLRTAVRCTWGRRFP